MYVWGLPLLCKNRSLDVTRCEKPTLKSVCDLNSIKEELDILQESLFSEIFSPVWQTLIVGTGQRSCANCLYFFLN